jgi:hypothetical protein
MIKYFVRTTGDREFDYNLNYDLLIDNEKKPVESFIKQLKYISDYDAVLLEDDLVLCDGFKSKIEEVINSYSDLIINFFTAPSVYFKTRMSDTFYYNQCTYYPKGIAGKIAYEMEQIYKILPELQYDVLEQKALVNLGIKHLTYRPCLVQHIDNGSLIQEKGKYPIRRTIYFEDYLNELDIDYKDACKYENKQKLTKLMNEKFKTFSFEVKTDGEY